MEMSALGSLLCITHRSLSTRWRRQEMEQKNDKRPSPCILDAVSVERVAFVGKVELGFTVQVGKVEFRGVKCRVECLSVEDSGTRGSISVDG